MLSRFSIPVGLGMVMSLTACATHMQVSNVVVADAGELARSGTFAMRPAESDSGQAISTLVRQRLEAFGHVASDKPAMIVEVGETQRSLETGAFIPGTGGEDAIRWVARPLSKRRTHRQVMEVRVRFLTPDTLAPFRVSTVRYLSSKGSVESHAGKMVDALFKTDPLKAPGQGAE